MIEYDPYAYLDEIVESTKKIIRALEKLTDDINELVYDLYSAAPNSEALSTWIMLLKVLAAYELHTEVFTTNYDLVLENVIDVGSLSKTIITGRVANEINTVVDPMRWHPPSEKRARFFGPGLLTKLHGSVDWQQGIDGRIIAGASRFTGQHQNHILIYPGFKGEPQEEPFVTFHTRLRLVAERAEAAVFIGYAFRDEYINSLLSSMPPGIPKLVINTEQSAPELDFLIDASHCGDGFTEESVADFIGLLVRHDLIKEENT